MRLRNRALGTGRLLAHFDPQDRSKNRGVLFLVEGAGDIGALTAVEEACQQAAATRPGFEWFDVVDQGHLAELDPHLDLPAVSRFEVQELSSLSADQLSALLTPALERLATHDGEPLFPSAGGAVGAPAEGVQFLDRTLDLRDLTGEVQAGRDVLLLAPRLEGTLRPEYETFFLDLQRHETPQETAARAYAQASKSTFRAARERARRDWRAVLRETFDVLAQEATSRGARGVVILLDELVMLLQSMRDPSAEAASTERIRDFLAGLAQSLSGREIRLVVAGSDPLWDFLEGLGLTRQDLPERLRSLQTHPLRRLAADDPLLELCRLLIGTGLVASETEIAWLTENVDLAIPFPALRFLDELASAVRGAGSLGEQALPNLLWEFLDRTDSFSDFERHLQLREEQAPAVERALDLIARSERLSVEEEAARSAIEQAAPGKGAELLAWMVETLPLRRGDGQITLESKLFGAWWRRQAGPA
jgi:hypothetical protein